MKTIRNFALLFVATILAFNVNAQSAATSTQENASVAPVKSTHREADKQAAAKAVANGNQTAATQTAVKTTEAKTAATTKASGAPKTADKINPAKKGPNGEAVYTGPKGGSYYLDKSGKKVYLKK